MHVGGQAAVRILDVVAVGERLDGVANVPVGVGVKPAAARKLDVGGWMACGDDPEPWNVKIAASPLPS